MEKSLQIFISIDDVPLAKIESIQDALEKIFEEYVDKRIQITIQDDPLVRPPRR